MAERFAKSTPPHTKGATMKRVTTMPYATEPADLILILRASTAEWGRKAGTAAQYRNDSGDWFGCTLLAVNGAVSTIRTRGYGETDVATTDVRIRLAD
jgi:hypothetical protein